MTTKKKPLPKIRDLETLLQSLSLRIARTEDRMRMIETSRLDAQTSRLDAQATAIGKLREELKRLDSVVGPTSRKVTAKMTEETAAQDSGNVGYWKTVATERLRTIEQLRAELRRINK